MINNDATKTLIIPIVNALHSLVLVVEFNIDWDQGKVVPRVAQILKRRWDAAASSTGVELVCKCGDFKVVEPSTVQDSNNNPHLPNMPLNAGQPNTIYIVKPELQWCTCGFWQDVYYLCWHGCAEFGRGRKRISAMSFRILVHPYYKFECIQRTHKNIFPACII